MRIPKGVLLVGPPGRQDVDRSSSGGRSRSSVLSVTGSDFMEMFVGVGASESETSSKQTEVGPSDHIHHEIDSIDADAGVGGGHTNGTNLNQMLAEMDGFEASEGIVMMAATNRPDILDPALLRPGRFDRQVVVLLPESEERSDILTVHAKDKVIDETLI